MVNIQYPGCNRQIQVDIVVMSMSDLEQSGDIYDAQLQLELLKVQHDHSAVLDWCRDVAEQTDMPLHAITDKLLRFHDYSRPGIFEEKCIIGHELLLQRDALRLANNPRQFCPIQPALLTGKWQRLSCK